MTDTTVDVSREGSTAILRIHGEITGGSEPPIMAAYAQAEGAKSQSSSMLPSQSSST